MRTAAIVVLAAALIAPLAHASVCTVSTQPTTAGPRWTLDRYVYDAALHQDWEVLVDCNHPAAPAQMQLASNSAHISAAEDNSHSSRIVIHAGAAVEVSNPADSPATIHLSGTAMQTAFNGQPIRVHLSAGGHFIIGLVRGPHSVELVASSRPSWGQ